jgi:hypothetical protein
MTWNFNTNRRGKTTSDDFICMCSDCHKVRDEQGQWSETGTSLDEAQYEVTHGFCPDCLAKWHLEVDAFVLAQSA